MATQTSNNSARSPKRGLGRGLTALIPESDFDLLSDVARGSIAPAPIEQLPQPAQVEETEAKLEESSAKLPSRKAKAVPSENEATPAIGEIRYLDLAQIEANPFQPRQVWNEAELDDLAASLREHGLLQPVLVRPLPGGKSKEDRFQLIAGERRWRAAARAELKQIPAIVREVDDKSALELAIIENVQRHDISPIESAMAYRRLSSEFDLSQEKIAARVGKSRSSITNTIRLLDLPPEAIESLKNNEITEGHGRALLTASNDGARRALLRRILRDHLSVREVERMAREGEVATQPKVRLPRANAADISRLENTLERALGVKLQLRARKNGGQIVINYSSTEELQRLATRLTGSKE